jgi:hypothetical protein
MSDKTRNQAMPAPLNNGLGSSPVRLGPEAVHVDGLLLK